MEELKSVHADWQADGGVLGSNRYMLDNQVDCDVTFCVGKQKQIISAHKYVLVSRSSVFYAMLRGPLQETGPIDVPDIEPDVFQQLLRYMYYEAFEPNGDSILVIALKYAATKYAVHLLVRACVKWLDDLITVENVCNIFQQAQALDETDLSSKCLDFITENGRLVLQQLSFENLSSYCVELIIKQNELCAKEEEVYEAVKGWAQSECARRNSAPCADNMRKVLGGLHNHIRYVQMDRKYFADRVIVDDILTTEEKLHLSRSFLGSDSLDTTCFIKTARKPLFQQERRVVRFASLAFPCPTAPNIHAIEFKCSRRVLLKGIVIYGATFSLRNPRRTSASLSFISNVSVKLLDDSKCTIVSMEGCRFIMEEKFQEILFDEPICLKPTWYAVILHIESPGHTYAGNKGETLINIDDEVFIEFRDCPLSTSPTNVERGQIPGLLLCI
ncbi:hypothetical protein ACJMK2_009098 [Sinanodonta woodiana]|uniref:BTB domain-containing protein n=2 Tax=Sinanodonta woodiana TaxID=1069815 RepID=A0ABD3VE73_SINWO